MLQKKKFEKIISNNKILMCFLVIPSKSYLYKILIYYTYILLIILKS